MEQAITPAVIAEVFPLGKIDIDDCRWNTGNFFGLFSGFKFELHESYLRILLIELKSKQVIQNTNGHITVDESKATNAFIDAFAKEAGLERKEIFNENIVAYFHEMLRAIINTGYRKESIANGTLHYINDIGRNRQTGMWSFTEEIR